jgi:hypothetical protein
MAKRVTAQASATQTRPETTAGHASAPSRPQNKSVGAAPTVRAGDEDALTEEQIAARAFEIWEEHGRPDGTAVADWFEARRQLEGSSAKRNGR